jgi:ABC-2 type transport system ATP-binding protein
MSSPFTADQLPVKLSGVSVQYRVPLGKRKRLSLKEIVVQFGHNSRKYSDFFALRDVDLQVQPGEIVGVIGRNGAGKSTLLAVISGVIKPIAGVVTVCGHVAPLLSLGAAFDMELTGRENIYLNAALLGFTRKETDERYDSIVAFSEIQEFIEAPYKTFSSGMGARLGFAVATAAEADVLLVDEVLAVGDVRFRKKCEERIARFRERKMTILYVSHDMETVQEMCTRVIWLERGRIVEDGGPDVVVPHYLEFMERR